MKMFKSKFMLLSSLISITGACIGTGVYAYTSANADKLELLNRSAANDTVSQLKETRSDIKIVLSKGNPITQENSGFAGAIIDNQLYMWGQNVYSQLGLGDASVGINKNVPTLVSGISGTTSQLALSAQNMELLLIIS